ncbi:acyltransferase [Francisella philomiragia]|uniref:acyltransferase family protein n=1 Tax=Francisella philomiragia TaxID=28110 RepID=UPI0019079654|nr:acyltransferase family protein [Francisella philomiragia]MBK2267811.1 acyltransferase [Francisella philomiragia]MBK2308204.1 acyltransferase [Francisella philomiragia]
MSNIKYRKDIDGLRAFAVLSVVLFHLNISWIKSGFLGVDIFFVISGFLITKIIVRDLQDGSFSIKNFYLRRIRRILPALIFVLAFSSFFAWLILLPQDLLNYAKSMVSAIASISNLFFFKTLNFGYFATDSSIIPLLHTWSLGVEEQFYIAWPVILIILFKLNTSSKKYLLTITLLLIIVSVAIFFYKHFPKFYYMPINRGFELLFGCFLAISLNNRQQKSPNKTLLDIYSFVSLILMAIPIFLISVNYPSFWMIVTCLGATLFIYSGSLGYTPFINRLFSIKPFVAIGVISYSLYLWHWPIIAYINYLSIEKTTLVCVVIFTISILLATLTYIFIEKPFRYRIIFSFKKSIFILWIIPLVISISFYAASKHQGFGFNKEAVNLNLNFYSSQSLNLDQCNTGENYNLNEINNNCFFGTISKDHTDILVLGDSHAMAYEGMINVWLKNLKLKGYIYTKSLTGDPKLYKYIMYSNSFDKNTEYYIHKLKPRAIILAGYWNYDTYLKTDAFKQIDTSVANFIKQGIVPIIMYDVYGGPKSTCGFTKLDKILGRECYSVMDDRNNFIKKLKHKYGEKLIVIDPNKLIEKKDSRTELLTSIGSTPLYTDNTHLNNIGSTLLGNLYLEKYGNPLSIINTKAHS